MKRLIHSLKSQSIGVLALFVALGGTGYAAISIPRNSVGSRQLRNGAVTANKIAKGSVAASKLDSKSIAGSVAFWAKISSTGQVLSSSRPAQTEGWGTLGGNIVFHGELATNCFPVADEGGGATTAGYLFRVDSSSFSGQTEIGMGFAEPGAAVPVALPVDVAEICP